MPGAFRLGKAWRIRADVFAALGTEAAA